MRCDSEESVVMEFWRHQLRKLPLIVGCQSRQSVHGVGETMLRKMRKQVSQHAKPSCETCETSETTLIAMLQSELEHKNQQLEVKDEQIRELNARLAESNAALVAAQQTA